MSRPCKKRRVDCNSLSMSFKPCGNNGNSREIVSLTLDELEAIRLADFDGLYQEHAAEKMKISRQTFGNIITTAHKKVADFIVNSKRLTIGGGSVEIDKCKFLCSACNHNWSISCNAERPLKCPSCASMDFYCSKNKGKEINFKKCWRIV